MNHKNITPGTLVEGSVSSTDISSDEINQLKAQMQDMQLEIDILKETINVLKKDPDIDQSALSNREKAVIIDVLKNRYSLPLLLQKLQLSKSSYYYQEQSLQKEDKYTLLRVRVIELFTCERYFGICTGRYDHFAILNLSVYIAAFILWIFYNTVSSGCRKSKCRSKLLIIKSNL